MPAMMNASEIAGPAWFLASTPVKVKMPVPMTMPIPNPIRSNIESLRRSPGCSGSSGLSSFWWMTSSTSFVRVNCLNDPLSAMDGDASRAQMIRNCSRTSWP